MQNIVIKEKQDRFEKEKILKEQKELQKKIESEKKELKQYLRLKSKFENK